MKCVNTEANSARCTCTYEGCARHGICCDCIAYHRASGEVPGCLFSAADERTYDRSIHYFVSRHR